MSSRIIFIFAKLNWKKNWSEDDPEINIADDDSREIHSDSTVVNDELPEYLQSDILDMEDEFLNEKRKASKSSTSTSRSQGGRRVTFQRPNAFVSLVTSDDSGDEFVKQPGAKKRKICLSSDDSDDYFIKNRKWKKC